MKGFFKFLLYFSSLLILAGFSSLYFGWIRFDYPNSYRGVVHFKSSGYSKALVNSQIWYWDWQNILPGNTTVYAVNLAPQSANLSLSGNLPSADALKELVEGKESFSYEIALNYTYSLKEQDLIDLYARGILNSGNDLSSIESLTEKLLKEKTEAQLSDLFRKIDNPDWENLLEVDLKNELIDSIKSQFPYFNDFELNLQILRFPNLFLYKRANETLISILQEREKAKRDEEIRQARGNSEEKNRIIWLERYGKLLKEYPELKGLLTSNNLELFSFFREG